MSGHSLWTFQHGGRSVGVGYRPLLPFEKRFPNFDRP